MSAMFWQAILPLAATGSCAVLVMLLLQWVLRRVAGVVPSPAMLAAALMFFLIPVGRWLSSAGTAVPGAGVAAAAPLRQAVRVMQTARLPQTPLWSRAVPQLWLAVAGFLLCWALAKRPLFSARLAYLRCAETDSPAAACLERLKRELGLPAPVRVYTLPGAGTPFVCGLLHPAVYLPSVLTGRQLEHSLRHELQHIQAGHLWYKLFVDGVAMLYWFCPPVWMARRCMDTLCELDCDRRVTGNMDGVQRQQYGLTLLSLAGGGVWGSGLSRAGRQLALRLTELKRPRTKRPLRAVLCLVCGLAVLLTGCGTAAILQGPTSTPAATGFDLPQSEPTPTPQPEVFEEQPAEDTVIWPVPDYSGISQWTENGHKGVDIVAQSGADILAMKSGTVLQAGWNEEEPGYGYSVCIDHGDGVVTLYAHCAEVYAQAGQQVEQGDRIAAVGSSGFSTGPHLHVELSMDGLVCDLRELFPQA